MSQSFEVIVERVTSQGADVADGPNRAFLPTSEFSWSLNPFDAIATQVSPQRRLLVVPLSTNGAPHTSPPDKRLVSHKRAVQRDPWKTVLDQPYFFKKGETLEATIYSVEPEVAWGETDELIQVRIDRSGIPLETSRPISQFVMSGDKVRGTITVVDKRERQIVLDLHPVFQTRFLALADGERVDREQQGEIQPAWKKIFPEVYRVDERKPLGPYFQNVLVIDDEQKVSDSIVDFLRSTGNGGYATADLVEAYKLLGQDEWSMALIDFQLQNCSAIDVLRETHRSNRQFPIVVYTGMVIPPEVLDMLSKYDVTTCMEKPIDVERLSRHLEDSTQSREIEFLRSRVQSQPNPSAGQIPVVPHLSSAGVLSQLCPADLYVLLQLNPRFFSIEALAESGERKLGLPITEQRLKYSLIRTVLEHDATLRETVRPSDQTGMDNLYQAVGPCAIIGIGVKPRNLPRCALFALRFGKGAEPFRRQEFDRFLQSANSVSEDMLQELDDQRLQQRRTGAHVGELTVSFVHEVKNLLEVVSKRMAQQHNLVDILVTSLKDYDQPSRERANEALADLSESVRRLQQASDHMMGVAFDHLSQIASDTPAQITLDDLVRTILQLSQPLARTNRVETFFNPGDVGIVCVEPVKLSQILYNLVLNAVENTGKVGRSSGRVLVRSYRTSNRTIVIDVADTGPGVNERFRESIFRRFFSTKSNGSGLGLDIARRLVQDSFGGDLDLLESYSLIGSTFRLTIPPTEPNHAPS